MIRRLARIWPLRVVIAAWDRADTRIASWGADMGGRDE